MESRSTILTLAAVTVATGVAAYAVYFDYKRRNDVEFRKKLKKDRKRVEKSVAQKDSQAPALEVTPAALREALQVIKNEGDPKSGEEKEDYFMTQVGIGEQLAAQGSTYYLPAAMAFYRALRIYPNPVDLLGIYQKTITEPVFKLIIEMTNLDVSLPSSSLIPGMGLDEDTSPTSGPPSEASSQEWDKVTDAGSHALAPE